MQESLFKMTLKEWNIFKKEFKINALDPEDSVKLIESIKDGLPKNLDLEDAFKKKFNEKKSVSEKEFAKLPDETKKMLDNLRYAWPDQNTINSPDEEKTLENHRDKKTNIKS
jgi:hypothetical protein